MKLARILSCVCLIGTMLMAACADDERPVLIATSTANATSLAQTSIPGTPSIVSTTQATNSTAATPTLLVNKDTIVATIDPSKPANPISPYIYGLAGSDDKDPNYLA